jgi:eukaryotic-like serine/threonine-protein kinase
MTAVADRTEFLRVLELSQLLDPETLAQLRDNNAEDEAPSAVAEGLIQKGLLTRFQTKQLLNGKHRGFVLGPYKLLDQIGQGGMGTVFIAEHNALKKRVALKVLSREHAENQSAVDRFQREARAASALAHPNIVRVHHVGHTAGVHYLVMEYVDGATLENILDRKGPFTAEQAVKIAVQTAAGLNHAHEKGFVHRDIKPENLMLTRAGTVKILDMGLTKSVNKAEDNLTGAFKADLILGTIDYLSPEQALQSDVDARADVYSLGATLFTLICGHSPYEGVPAQQKLMQHQFGKVPDLIKFRPEIPKELAAVVSKMMAKKPDERYASVADVIEALAPWMPEDSTLINEGLQMPSMLIRSIRADAGLTPTLSNVATPTQAAPIQPPTQTIQADRTPAEPFPAAPSTKTLAANVSAKTTSRLPAVTSPTPELKRDDLKPKKEASNTLFWVGLALVLLTAGGLVAFFTLQ